MFCGTDVSERNISGKRAALERAAQQASGSADADADADAAGAAAPSGRTDTSGAGSQLAARAQAGPKRFVRQQVPDEVLHDAALNLAIAVLPVNYNFEVRFRDLSICEAQGCLLNS